MRDTLDQADAPRDAQRRTAAQGTLPPRLSGPAPKASPAQGLRTNLATMLTCGMIKAGRDLVGWTQADLAARAGVSVPTIQRLEDPLRGPLRASGATLVKLVDAFGTAGVRFDLTPERLTIVWTRAIR